MIAATTFDLSSGALCLDFTNTLEGRLDPVPSERLSNYHDLVGFGLQAGLFSEAEAEHLHALATRRPFEAAGVHASALALREAIFRIMAAIADGERPDPDELASLQDAVSEAFQHGRLIPSDDGFSWDWDERPPSLDRVLWPVAYSALDLLTNGELDRLRKCAADDCAWLFFDTSRNRSRKWCDMKTCGNRAKVARFRERHEHDHEGNDA